MVDSSIADLEDIDLESPFNNFSFSRYLYEETISTEIERESSIYKTRKKRIYTFLSIPKSLESFLLFSIIICVDHFLWIYTFLLIRCVFVPFRFAKRLLFCVKNTSLFSIEEFEDVIKLSLVILLTIIIFKFDTSVIYHQIRSQSVIKLYIFFNLLETVDRLLSPLGQDIMDALSWTVGKGGFNVPRHLISFLGQYIFALLCFFIHLLVMVSQTTILNVAFNSHSNSLLTIMMSNNLIELKGNVFRKVEKTNLFQMSCADARERFQYFVMLCLVVFRNIMEIGWSYGEIKSMLLVFFCIMFSEVLVDWVKHAFVTKFNFISADVYPEFSASLAYDFVLCKMGKNSSSYFELIGRRMGLTSIPLAALLNLFLFKKLISLEYYVVVIFLIVLMFIIKIAANILLMHQSYHKVHNFRVQNNEKNENQSQSTKTHESMKTKDSNVSGNQNEDSPKNPRGDLTESPSQLLRNRFNKRNQHNSNSNCFIEFHEESVISKQKRVYSEYDIVPPLLISVKSQDNNNCSSNEFMSTDNADNIVHKRNASFSDGFGYRQSSLFHFDYNFADKSIDSDNEQEDNDDKTEEDTGGINMQCSQHTNLSGYQVNSEMADKSGGHTTPTNTNQALNSAYISHNQVSPRHHERYRTISSLTEDLSDQTMEPLVHSGEDACGITSGINDGSLGAAVAEQINCSTSSTTADFDLDNPVTPSSSSNELATGANNSNFNNSNKQPLSDVDRFSMYTNQIV